MSIYIRNSAGTSNFKSDITVSTIADLTKVVINAAIPNGTVAKVDGYYTAGDGGGGIFYWNSTSTDPDNGGTIFQVAGQFNGRWIRQFTGTEYDVTWFGIKLDGTTDNSAILTRLYATVINSPYGGTIFVPYGNMFLGTSQISFQNLDPLKSFTLECAVGAKITSNASLALQFNNCKNITLKNVVFDGYTQAAIAIYNTYNLLITGCNLTGGNRLYNPGTMAILSLDAGTSLFTIENTTFKNWGDGSTSPSANTAFAIYGSTATHPTFCKGIINNCTFLNGTGSYGIGLYDVQDVTITNNYIDMNYGPQVDFRAGYGILLYSTRPFVPSGSLEGIVRHSIISNNKIYRCSGPGIYMATASHVICTSNYIEDTCTNANPATLTIGAIGGSTNYFSITCSNNIINKVSSNCHGIRLIGEGIEIGDNIISYVTGGFGILLDGADYGCSVHDNQISNCSIGIGGSSSGTSGVVGVSIVNNAINHVNNGIYFDDSVSESTIDGNWVRDCLNNGITLLTYSKRNHLTNNFVKFCGSFGYDIRGTDNQISDCTAIACTNNGFIIQGSNHRVHNISYSNNGTPGTLVGNINLNGLTYPALLGLTIITNFGTVTFDSSEGVLTPQQVPYEINNKLSGVEADMDSTTGFLKLRSSLGNSLLQISGGTALATLGLANSSNSGSLPTVDPTGFYSTSTGNSYSETIVPALGTVVTTGNLTVNLNPATLGSQQYGPAILSEGQGWKTAATAGSQKAQAGFWTIPVQGVNNPSVRMPFGYRINSGAFINYCLFDSLPAATQGRGLVTLYDTGRITNGESIIAIHQDDNLARAIGIFDDSGSTTSPSVMFRASGASFILEGAVSGTIQLWSDINVFSDQGGNPTWRFRSTNTGPGRGIWLEASAGYHKIGQEDLTTNGSSANDLGIHAQNETGTGVTLGGTLHLSSGDGYTKGDVSIEVADIPKLVIKNSYLDMTAVPVIKKKRTALTTPVAVTTTDYIVLCNLSIAGAVVVNLPIIPLDGQIIIIKDAKGDAVTNNITINGNGKNIDGYATYVLNTSYGNLELVYDNFAGSWKSINNGNGTGVMYTSSNLTLQSISPEPLSGTQFFVGSSPTPWIYDRSSGAGFAADGYTIDKLSSVSLGSNGRFYRATSSPTMPTVASLRSAPGGKHQRVRVLAFATLGDGGGGEFYWDASSTTTDDGGTIISPGGTGRWKRQYIGNVQSIWFGIKADGSDETITFNTARAVALAAGKALVLNVGTIGVLGSSLTALSSGEILLADTYGKVTIKNLITPTNILATKIFFGNNVSNILFSDIIFDCIPGTASTLDTCGVELIGTSNNIQFDNCQFMHFSSAIRIWDSCVDSAIRGCKFLQPKGCIDANFYGGYLHHNVTVDITGPQSPTREDHIRGLLIEGCQFYQASGEGPEGRGLALGTSTVGCVVDNCTFDGWRYNNLLLSNSAPISGYIVCKGHVISNTSFLNANATTARGIFAFNGIQDCVIDACIFYNIPGDAIEFLDCEGMTVRGGKFAKCGAYHDDTDGYADQGYDYNKTNAFGKQGGIRISYSVPFYRRGNKIVGCEFIDMASYGVCFAGYATSSTVEECDFWRIGGQDVKGTTLVRRAISAEWNDGGANLNRIKIQGCRGFLIGREAIVLTGNSVDSEISENKFGNCGLALPASSMSIVSATNASPIVIKLVVDHCLETNDHVDITSVGGNTAANGNWAVTVIDSNTLSLQGSTGNGSYTSGGILSSVFTITTATNTNPIDVTTSTAHGFAINSLVVIQDVLGNTATNGYYRVSSVPTSTRFTLSTDTGTPIAGNGTYISGGKVAKAADAIVVGQATSVIGSIFQASTDRLRLIHNTVYDDSALGSQTRYAIRYIGTISDSIAINNEGYGTRWGAVFGAGFAFGSNTVYQLNNVDYNSGPKLQPIFAVDNIQKIDAVGKISWGALNLAGANATTGSLSGSKVTPTFGAAVQISGGYLTLAAATPSTITNALMVGSSSAPSQALHVTGSVLVTGSFYRPDNAGAAMTIGNGTYLLNADTSTIKSGNSSATFFSWSSTSFITNIEIQPASGVYFNWLAANSQATVGASGGASALPANPQGYAKIRVNGTVYVIPYYTQ